MSLKKKPWLGIVVANNVNRNGGCAMTRRDVGVVDVGVVDACSDVTRCVVRSQIT
jgi:hypothetical protein